MSRAELRLRPHLVGERRQIVELWYDGEFIATITVVDAAPIVSVMSERLKNPAQVLFEPMCYRVEIILTKR